MEIVVAVCSLFLFAPNPSFFCPGSYAKVKEAVDIHSLRRVAVKIFDKAHLRKLTGGEAAVEREVQIQQRLKHINIVEIIEEFADEEKDRLYIVLEYMAGGSLQTLLDRAPNHRLPMAQTRRYVVLCCLPRK